MVLDVAGFDLNRIDRAFVDDPYPTLDALRAAAPVHRNADGSVYLTRHDDCLAVYRLREMLSDKREAFGEKFGAGCPLHTHHTTSLIFNDPPYHTVVRKLIAGAFTPAACARWKG